MTAPWTAGRADDREAPPLRRPGGVPRGRRSSSLSAPPHARPSTTTARALQPSVSNPWIAWSFVSDLSIHRWWQRWGGGALRRPRRLLPRPQPLGPQESRMDMYFSFGSKGQSLSICISY